MKKAPFICGILFIILGVGATIGLLVTGDLRFVNSMIIMFGCGSLLIYMAKTWPTKE